MLAPEQDARLVTFSTDYVFGGDAREPYREDAEPAPVQLYGISRLAGERAALAYAPRHAVVIRTCGLYGRAGSKSRGGNFVDARAAEARAGKRIEMACEQVVGAPTSTDDLSRAVLALIENAGLRPGIYHLVNEGVCTWFEFTQEIARLSGGGAEVVPVDRGGRFAGVSRPSTRRWQIRTRVRWVSRCVPGAKRWRTTCARNTRKCRGVSPRHLSAVATRATGSMRALKRNG